jgi:hypothetical protein
VCRHVKYGVEGIPKTLFLALLCSLVFFLVFYSVSDQDVKRAKGKKMKIFIKNQKVIPSYEKGAYSFEIPDNIKSGNHYLIYQAGRTETYVSAYSQFLIFTWHVSGAGTLLKHFAINKRTGRVFPTPRALLEKIGASGELTFATELPDTIIEILRKKLKKS